MHSQIKWSCVESVCSMQRNGFVEFTFFFWHSGSDNSSVSTLFIILSAKVSEYIHLRGLSSVFFVSFAKLKRASNAQITHIVSYICKSISFRSGCNLMRLQCIRFCNTTIASRALLRRGDTILLIK